MMTGPLPAHAGRAPWRDRWHEIIFGHDTAAGRRFDLILLVVILASVLNVLLESVRSVRDSYGLTLHVAEWIFLTLFTLEYIARIATATDAKKYALSFFGIVDLVAVAPIYLSMIFGGAYILSLVRVLRLLRVFRILKLGAFLGEAYAMKVALRESFRKIAVFLFFVLTIVVLVGAMMYEIEGDADGFTSIPTSMYWAIVTVTTVGYGDISPRTVAGRMLASLLMIIGYGIIAVPTGIVSFEFARAGARANSLLSCKGCGLNSHDRDALFCKRCGGEL
jgi:voltage-gated potassium channel